MKSSMRLSWLIVFALFIPSFRDHSEAALSAKREMGHFLFFDKDLSRDGNLSCSHCHDPLLAFTDGYRVSMNGNAELLLRNAPSLLNINRRSFFSWSDPNITDLAMQMQRPLFALHPEEMGLMNRESEIVERLSKKKIYRKLYPKAYGRSIDCLKFDDLIECIIYYERNLQSRNSKFDKFLQSRDSSYLTANEKIGMRLFFSDSLFCHGCHGGLDFFEPKQGMGMANIGLYNCNGSYPLRDLGLQRHTGLSKDNGVFRIPSLRNVAITSPYYHDGSEISLEEVIMNYERAGRKINTPGCESDGALHPNVDKRISKFSLSAEQRRALIAFLHTLTDTSYLSQYYFNNPFNFYLE